MKGEISNMLQIKKMRLPTCEEYDLLATAVKEDNNRMQIGRASCRERV